MVRIHVRERVSSRIDLLPLPIPYQEKYRSVHGLDEELQVLESTQQSSRAHRTDVTGFPQALP